MAPTTSTTARRTRRALPHIAAAAALTALALAGCGQQGDTTAAQTATPQPLPTPTQILTPAPDEACSVRIASSTGDETAPDEATVTCGDSSRTVAGDFRRRHINGYDPDATSGISQIIAVDGEVSVWLRDGEGKCLVETTRENPSVQCRPIGRQSTPAPEPEAEQTVVPEDQHTADA